MVLSTLKSEHQADYQEVFDQIEIVRDCIEGEQRIKSKDSDYLPIPSAFDSASDKRYQAYKQRASFYAVAQQTLEGMVGMLTRTPPSYMHPEALDPLVKGRSYMGRTLPMLLAEAFREQLSVGRLGILTDIPPEGQGAGVPYFALYKAEDIVRVDIDAVGPKPKLVGVRLRDDTATESDYDTEAGDTRSDDGEYYLDLLLIDGVYSFRRVKVERPRNEKPVEAILSEGVVEIRGQPIDFIPFEFVNSTDAMPGMKKPPMIDLCNVNVAHYRNSADYEHAMFFAGQPTMWATGITDDDNIGGIGGGSFWRIANENAKVGMLEYKGECIKDVRQAMIDKEGRMVFLGARMIQGRERNNETAEAARIRSSGETSVLQAAVNAMEQAINASMYHAAAMMGVDVDPDESMITLNRDFVDAAMPLDQIQALVRSWQGDAFGAQYSEPAIKTMYHQLKTGEVLAPDITFEDYTEAVNESQGNPPSVDAAGLVAAALPVEEAQAVDGEA